MEIIKKYKEIENEIEELNLSKKIKIKSTLTGLLFGFVIMLIPILICINLFIIYHLVPLLIFLIMIFLTIFSALSFYFYYEALKVYEEKIKKINTKFLIFIDTAILFIILCIIMIVIFITLNLLKIL